MGKIKATVKNKAGIHVRPSGLIINAVKDYPGKIILNAKGTSTLLKGVVDLLVLGLIKGDTVQIEVNGPKEEALCEKLKSLFETEFDFPPKEM